MQEVIEKRNQRIESIEENEAVLVIAKFCPDHSYEVKCDVSAF